MCAVLEYFHNQVMETGQIQRNWKIIVITFKAADIITLVIFSCCFKNINYVSQAICLWATFGSLVTSVRPTDKFIKNKKNILSKA